MIFDNITSVGVIDSGIGGISIVKKLLKTEEIENIIYFADNMNMPYGSKTKEFIQSRIEEIINILFQYKVQKIYIACNTASTCYETKDPRIVKMKFDNSKTYFATKLTKKNSPNLNVIADLNLAKQIENNIFDDKIINKLIKNSVTKHGLKELNECVLGCTHYELVDGVFKKYCPNTKIYCNSDFIIEDCSVVASKKNVFVILSKQNKQYKDKIWKLIRD